MNATCFAEVRNVLRERREACSACTHTVLMRYAGYVELLGLSAYNYWLAHPQDSVHLALKHQRKQLKAVGYCKQAPVSTKV